MVTEPVLRLEKLRVVAEGYELLGDKGQSHLLRLLALFLALLYTASVPVVNLVAKLRGFDLSASSDDGSMCIVHP